MGLVYLLIRGPDGLSVDPLTGLLQWSPTADGPAESIIELAVYDSRGARDVQQYVLRVAGGNHSPVIDPLPQVVEGAEGEALTLTVTANDADGDSMFYWADRLPHGAAFDAATGQLAWTPDYDSAGVYGRVTFFVSDGVTEATAAIDLVIHPTDRGPTLRTPPGRTVREGDRLRFYLEGDDPDGDPIVFSAAGLPAGATVNANTGLVDWPVGFDQAGQHDVAFSATGGSRSVTRLATFTVTGANASPVFDPLDAWRVFEGEQVSFRAFAFDPDNPGFIPPDRLPDGSLTPLAGTDPTVSYSVAGLPSGAEFDDQTAVFAWVPDFDSAGDYAMTFTATDDGDGTGVPLATSVTVAISVVNLNRRPQITPITNQSVDRDGLLEVTVEATDPDGNPLVLEATSAIAGFGLPEFAGFVDHGDGTGTLAFAPKVGDRGDYSIQIIASDDRDGGSPAEKLSDSYTFVVTIESENEPPRLEYIGDKVAVAGELFELTIRAQDLDQEPLDFNLTGLPAAATLTPGAVYGTALLGWTPSAADLGSYAVGFEVTDQGNGNPALVAQDTQDITLVVRSSNIAPVLAAIGDRTVAEGQTLTIALSASDADGDPITYDGANLPSGATLDRRTGVLTWTPRLDQAGRYENVAVTAGDGHSSHGETIAIEVANTNRPPRLVPIPARYGREGTLLSFTVVGGDDDGDPLSYDVSAGLPDGAAFDPANREFRWTPDFDQAGEHVITFGLSDTEGGSDSIDVALRIDDVNRPPVVDASDHAAALGRPLVFFVQATDPDPGNTLTYAAENLPEGATLDGQTGQFAWTPGPGQAGEYVVTLSASDGALVTKRSILIRADVEPALPQVTLELTPSFPAVPGQTVTVHAIAGSLADIAGIELTVDGVPLLLDATGRAQITAGGPGKTLIEAVATDGDGLAGRTSALLKVRDPADASAPLVALDGAMPQLFTGGPEDLVGRVLDANLDFWRLELARLGSNDFHRLAAGETPVEADTLVQLDPEQLANGFYRLRLVAQDISGRTASVETSLEVNTPSKPAAYRATYVDLAVNLGGIPVELTRAYDSLARDVSGRLGSGWRLVNREVGIETNVPSTGRETLGVFNALGDGVRLYLTIPSGQRVGFTFRPVEVRQNSGLVYYQPAWEADLGVGYVLESADALLSKAQGRYYGLSKGVPYHPASPFFEGPDYTLTAPDGGQMLIDTERGVVEEIRPSGERLFYGDSGVVAGQGDAVQFTHDTRGRLVQAQSPDGNTVAYQYDDAGNLILLSHSPAGSQQRFGYDPTDSNLLTVAVEGITTRSRPTP